MVDHSLLAAKGGDLAGGASETVSADLKPGKYELICHVAGHYQAGQTLPFEVTLASVRSSPRRHRSRSMAPGSPNTFEL